MNIHTVPKVTGEQRIPAAGFGLVVVLWAVFGAVLLLEPSRLDVLWEASSDLPSSCRSPGGCCCCPGS